MLPVKFKSREIVEEESSLALVQNRTAEPLTLGEDANIGLRIDPAPAVDAPLAFAGYGLKIPEATVRLLGVDAKKPLAILQIGTTVRDRTTTTHRVRISRADRQNYGGSRDVADLVRQSFEFLLARESNTSILRDFDLSTIERYFPEYPRTIRGR